jgi:hypothetical protein
MLATEVNGTARALSARLGYRDENKSRGTS